MNRFINCDCIKNNNGELVPLWNISWKLDSEYEDPEEQDLNSFIKPTERNINECVSDVDIVKALYDLVDKKVVPCRRVIKIYELPTGNNAMFKEGDEIFVKCKFSTNKIYSTKIKTISQGKENGIYYTTEDNLKNWLDDAEIIEDISLDNGSNVVQIITYRKHYVLEDGTETDYDYDFLKLEEK